MVVVGVNPHIWLDPLDPMLAKHQIDKIRNVMARSDPDPANADYYNQNTDRFSAELDSLMLLSGQSLPTVTNQTL